MPATLLKKKLWHSCFTVNFEKHLRTLLLKNTFRQLLEILENSQENTCARVPFLINLQAQLATILKKRLWHRCFPVNFAKFLRILFLKNTSGRLLLSITSFKSEGSFFKRMIGSNLSYEKTS